MTPHERTLELVREIAFKNQMTAAQILGPSREKPVAKVRHAIICKLYLEGWGKSEIARFFNRDHTTIGYVIRKLSPTIRYPHDSLSVPVCYMDTCHGRSGFSQESAQ